MPKVILQVDWSSENKKKKAIKMVSENEEVESFTVDDENKRLTVVGDMDPVKLVKKMRKHFPATDIVFMKTETLAAVGTPAAVEIPQQEPSPPYPYLYPHGPYYGRPSAPPYLGDNSYYPAQSYPANGPPYHSYPSNWGQPWPPSGGYYG
ncbi:uncharacterized protein LOC115671591 [Syzygium oleosum]|uniref:uncharacterized protein LOC115671591 n=1 Tax=Syzygium oleosum TaxID=219896 RepID=UPI0011D249BC|nr:uncharacterized protein LOC115671591 [Syzygium oleosum]